MCSKEGEWDAYQSGILYGTPKTVKDGIYMRNPLSRYILIFKRWAWLILLGVVLCGCGTYVVTKLMHPVYQATALLVLNVSVSPSPYENTTASLELLPTYTQLITTPAILGPIASKHGYTLQQLTPLVAVKSQANSQIIEVDVQNQDPRLATQIANEIAQSFAQFSTSNLGGVAQFQILPAQQPLQPIKPKPSLDALIGAVVGLGLALALIVVFEWLDDRLTQPEEIQSLLGLDLLTTIPILTRRQRVKNAEDTPALAEGCRILCASLNNAQASKPFKLLMITSALAGEGKSTVAANVASFLALSGKRVLLVDADLRHPVLNQHFQLENQQGFSNAFLDTWAHLDVDLKGQPTEIPSLRVLTAGVLPSNPTELLQSPLAHQLFQHFKEMQQFDYIIFDTSPLLPVADSLVLACYVQAAVLVVDASKTPRSVLMRAKQALSKTGVRLVGVALNKCQWPDYGEIREYLNEIEHERPRAGIALTLPPQTAPTNGHAGDDKTITLSLRSQQADE
jgi:capsular exopolysaccharide synthesis family protein